MSHPFHACNRPAHDRANSVAAPGRRFSVYPPITELCTVRDALGQAYISAASSRGHCNTSASFSEGDIQPRVCRGRPLRECAALSRSAWVSRLMSVPLGKY